MKDFRIKSKISWIFLTIVLSLSSCSDFLEVTPVGKTTAPTAFSDIRGMRSAMAGTYYTINNFYSGLYYVYPDIAGNAISLPTNTSGASLSLYNYEIITNNTGYWGSLYEALVNVNNIIEYQPSLLSEYPENKDELESIKAQALFFRALCHFDLCRAYAQPYSYTPDASHLGVPIELTAPYFDHKPARNSVKEVYDQIIKDLKDAESEFGEKPINTGANDKYYVCKYAVYALLSRVYLYMEDWDNAIKYAGYVIDKIPLANTSDYLSMYSSLENKETEIIFRFNGSQNKASTLLTLFNITYKKNADGTEEPIIPSVTIENSLLNLYSSTNNDIRYRYLLEKITDKTGGEYYVTHKFNIRKNEADYEHFNPIVLRCSEMYLNRAEAYLNKDDLVNAAKDVKAIIARALEKDPSEIVVTETNKAQLKKIIEDERTKELCFEGHQLYDITRRKQDMVRSLTTTSSVQKLLYPNDLFVKPIPQRELDINPNMVGNPTVNK